MEKNDFIKKANIKHGNSYDYSLVDYVDCNTDVEIICRKHGNFWQKPVYHLRGHGCPICSNEKRGPKKITTCELVERFCEVHGDKYDYSKVVYEGPKSKVTVICKEHGEFEQLPFAHLSGQGCPKCSGVGLQCEDYIRRFREVHGDKYDYSKADIKKTKDKITIICPEHGEFLQSPQKHLLGQGCPECAKKNRGIKNSCGFEEFVHKSILVHGDKYEYVAEGYRNLHSKVRIICPKHGEFNQIAYDHLNGHGCPSCGVHNSNGEKEIYEYVCGLVGRENVERHNRSILNGKEIDIFIPKLNIGIEYNGCIWHSTKFNKDKNYHLNKMLDCGKKGVSLIQIFEDEYLKSKNVVLSKIRSLCGCANELEKVQARKCACRIIDKSISKVFLEKNHIQGYATAKVHIGCYNGDMLVGVMLFKEDKSGNWNMVRFASDIDKHCIGVGGKLMKYFIENYNPESIKTFCDRRWTMNEDNLYSKLGFTLAEILLPDYRYVSDANPNRMHKFNFRKGILSKRYNLDEHISEREMCDDLGFYRVYDCGLYRYEWKRETV